MPADRNHTDHTFRTGVGHQRLEHLVFVESELGGGLNSVAVIHMIVRMCVFIGRECDSGLVQLYGRRCGTGAFLVFFLAHGVSS